MKYSIISDLHGSLYNFYLILSVLEKEGWEVLYTDDMRPYLFHETDVLIVAGDINDRGNHSAELMWLLYGSHIGNLKEGLPTSVVTLMGNHDIKVFKHFYLDKDWSHPDWEVTKDSFYNHPRWADDIKRWITHVPYTFQGPNFQVAHAYYSSSKDLCMYGPRNRDEKDILKAREKWWEVEVFDKFTFFGHYHHKLEHVDPNGASLCVDNWDADVATIGIVDDGEIGVEIIHSADNAELYSEVVGALT